MTSGFKTRLTRLHASRQRLRQASEETGEDRVFYAEPEDGEAPVAPAVRESSAAHSSSAAQQSSAPQSTSGVRAEGKRRRKVARKIVADEVAPLDASRASRAHHTLFSRPAPDPASRVAAWAALGARTQPTQRGEAHYLWRTHPAETFHGRRLLSEAIEKGGSKFPSKFHHLLNLADTDPPVQTMPDSLAFVDLETNGLTGGCYPFCVGVGVWESAGFSVYHFLMTAEEDEPAVLRACVDLLGTVDGICTFNGAGFDVPMLRRRCEHHGVAHPFDTLAHLDLLRVSRKLYPGRKSHRLGYLEQDLLEFRRHGDIPSAQIPGMWQQYLKSGDPQPLRGIFEHNRLDILSMVVLLPEFLAARRTGERPAAAAAQARAPMEFKELTGLANLQRSYALRQRSVGGRAEGARAPMSPAPGGGETPESPVSRRPSFSHKQLATAMPIGARLRELRAEVEQARAQNPDAALEAGALAKVFEILAFAPRHPFALEALVAHYRHENQPQLAEFFAARLQDAAPF